VPTAWPSFLRGNAAEVLAHLTQGGDPLRLVERSAMRLRQRWILLDPDRVYYRALGVCADAAPCEEPTKDLEAWAIAKIDLAIEQLVREDREAEAANPGVPPEGAGTGELYFPLLTDCFMIDDELSRAASVAFNALPPEPRRALFELLVEGRKVTECVEGGPWNHDALKAAVRTAISTLGLDAKPRRADHRNRRTDL
jgi:hypothetical protein